MKTTQEPVVPLRVCVLTACDMSIVVKFALWSHDEVLWGNVFSQLFLGRFSLSSPLWV